MIYHYVLGSHFAYSLESLSESNDITDKNSFSLCRIDARQSGEQKLSLMLDLMLIYVPQMNGANSFTSSHLPIISFILLL